MCCNSCKSNDTCTYKHSNTIPYEPSDPGANTTSNKFCDTSTHSTSYEYCDTSTNTCAHKDCDSSTNSSANTISYFFTNCLSSRR